MVKAAAFIGISLLYSDSQIGTWSEYAQLPYLECVILPEDIDPEFYSGSLVNIITPYACWKQSIQERHKGIINTAGNSATGIAMLGICTEADFPIISIVRKREAKHELEKLGAKHVLVQSDSGFKDQLKNLSERLEATAIFDGVGGAVLNDMIDVVSPGSTVYAYDFLGGNIPLSFHTNLLMKGPTIKGFNNFKMNTVQGHEKLEQAHSIIQMVVYLNSGWGSEILSSEPKSQINQCDQGWNFN